MNDADFSEVRSMKSRNEAAALAKKYVKACEAVADFEQAFETHATLTRMYRSPQVCHNSPAPIGKDSSLAIVPLVKGALVAAPLSVCNSDFSRRESSNPKKSPSPSMFTEQMRNVSQSVIFQRCASVFSMLVRMALYVSLFVIILYGCYFGLGCIYIGLHPEILAKFVVRSLAAAPTIGGHVMIATSHAVVSESMQVLNEWLGFVVATPAHP